MLIKILLVLAILISGCTKDDKTKVEEPPIGVEAYKYLMPDGGIVVHPVHGKEEWFAYGAMAGEDGTPANGVVQSYRYEDDSSSVSMQLNIAPAGEGTFYEAWIGGGDSADSISMGHLVNHFGDARHQLSFEMEHDLSAKLTVTVTLEHDDGDPQASENLVAGGVLKPTKR